MPLTMTNLMKNNQGSITPALLVITGAFIVVIYGLLILLSVQLDLSNRQIANEKALHIADAGVNYYLWHLTIDPGDYQDDTGGPGPYIHEYYDSQGQLAGSYSLQIIPPQEGSSIVTIESTGWSSDYPNVTREIRGRYGRTLIPTNFAFALNSNIWFGSEVTVNGPIFSNGGIRQDGTNTSTMESSKATYICGIETGCTNPTEKPGIWGNGGPEELWHFPVTAIDFESITLDFNQAKTDAQTSGLYLEPSSEFGYHLVFDSGGGVSVNKVTSTDFYKAYSLETGCENLYEIITDEESVGTYQVSNLPIIFIEDDTWIDGTLNGKTTVVAARFPIDINNADVFIPDNLTYVDLSGDHKLGLISQQDILITRDIPDYFQIDAALLAQKGRVIRHHYKFTQCNNPGPGKIKEEFILNGSLTSNLTSYWNFSGGPQTPAAGFKDTIINYDSDLSFDPPLFFPEGGQYELISWEEY